MSEPFTVMIIGENLEICNRLESDLKALGFKSRHGAYLDLNKNDITRKIPSIILLEITVLYPEALSVCDLLLKEDFLPPETALVGLLSEDTMGQTILEYRFDEFIKYPYSDTELGFRLQRAQNICQKESATDIINIGNLTVSLSTWEVKLDGQPVLLTYKEFALLKYLITHNDRVSTREVLLSNIWDDDIINGSRTVDVHIRRLRAKIGDIASSYIKTVRGVGYILRLQD